MTKRNNMCGKKLSFRTKAAAEKNAGYFGLRVYECPICFCYHCTSKENWRDEFVTPDQMETFMQEIRTEYNRKIKEKNRKIMEYEKEVSDLKKEIKRLTK